MVAPSLRVVFFGTPAFAVPTLDRLLASRHHVAGVVTQPDRPRGRGQKTTDAPVKARALAAGLPVQQPSTLKDPAALAALASFGADIGIVAAYGKILSDAVLAIPRLGMLNVHASLLPHYRGAAPIHRAVIAGETETGVTIMRVVRALDAGPMLAVARTPIGPDATSDEVEAVLATQGAELLVSTLDRLHEGLPEIPQDHDHATYAHRLTKEDGIVDWSRPAAAIHNQIRGLHPWPHAYAYARGQRFILHRSTPITQHNTAAAPGTLLAAHGDDLTVATGSGVLRVLLIQAEGKRPMTAREFLAGSRLTAGDRFSAAP